MVAVEAVINEVKFADVLALVDAKREYDFAYKRAFPGAISPGAIYVDSVEQFRSAATQAQCSIGRRAMSGGGSQLYFTFNGVEFVHQSESD